MNIIDELSALNLPAGQYVVCGSAVMAIRGIRDAHDIDLVVAEKLYEKLRLEGWDERFWPTGRPKELHKGVLDVGTAWSVAGKYHPDPRILIKNAEIIHGIPFVRLEDLIAWKQAAARSKDLEDLKLIQAYLQKGFPY